MCTALDTHYAINAMKIDYSFSPMKARSFAFDEFPFESLSLHLRRALSRLILPLLKLAVKKVSFFFLACLLTQLI